MGQLSMWKSLQLHLLRIEQLFVEVAVEMATVKKRAEGMRVGTLSLARIKLRIANKEADIAKQRERQAPRP